MKKYIHILLLFLVLTAAFIVRFYKFSAPIADWHSWRQADTSSVSRIFVQNGFDLLHPRFHDLSNVASGKDNPNGYRFVEFPIYNVFQAGAYSVFGQLTLEEWGRLVTILAAVISTFLLYAIVSNHAERSVALASAFFFALLPYNIFYGRVILPDPLMVTFTLGGIYFFDRWICEDTKFKNQSAKPKIRVQNVLFFSLSLISIATALLLKPFAIFFFLPIVALLYQEYGLGFLKKWQPYLFAIAAITPLVLWRWWMLQFPEGIPANDWLFNGGNMRFKGAFFYWIFADHIGKQILGYVGYGLFLIGVLALSSALFVKQKKARIFFLSFLLSTLLYFFVVARGNIQHDYYQIPIIPSLAIFLGFGATFLIKPIPQINRITSYLILSFFVFFMFFFGWYHIRDLFNINNPNIIIAGEMVDKLTPKNAKIITFYGGDTSFLYQTKRSGWSSLERSLPEMITIGADYLAIVDPTEKDQEGLGKEYPVVASDEKYLILKLHK